MARYSYMATPSVPPDLAAQALPALDEHQAAQVWAQVPVNRDDVAYQSSQLAQEFLVSDRFDLVAYSFPQVGKRSLVERKDC